MPKDQVLYPMRDGVKMTETDIIELYKFEDHARLTCKAVQNYNNTCPQSKDEFTCFYCMAHPENYRVILKKENIKKIKERS